MAFTAATKFIKPLVRSGSGSPVGSVTPRNYGEVYIDEGVGSYTAYGLTNTDWVQQGGAGFGTWTVGSDPVLSFVTPGDLSWSDNGSSLRYVTNGTFTHIHVSLRGTPTFTTASGVAIMTWPGGTPSYPQSTVISSVWNRNTQPDNSTGPVLAYGSVTGFGFAQQRTGSGGDDSLEADDFTSGQEILFQFSCGYRNA